jgi:hypothetical protein
LRKYTFQDIVDNWDELSNHRNPNIKTIKFFVENPDEITELTYDERGLEDGYHRLIASKILNKHRVKYTMLKESHLPPPTYLRRRFSEDDLDEAFKEAMGYIINSSVLKNLSLKRKKEVVVSLVMDELHPILSSNGTQDFNYDEIHDYLVHYYSPKVEKVLNINEHVDNTAKIRLNKLIDNQGLDNVIRTIGLDKVSKILQKKPIEIAKEYFEDKIYSIHDFDVRTGTYDFRFKITDIIKNDPDDEELYVYTKIVNGTVDIDGDERDLWDSDLWQEDYWWEIQQEIDDILVDILTPFLSKDIIEINHDLR